MIVWFWVILVIYWLIFCALLYRNRKLTASNMDSYTLASQLSTTTATTQRQFISTFDLSVLIYFPLLVLWVLAIYPTVTYQHGLGYIHFLGLVFIPVIACVMFFTKRLWLLSARYGDPGDLSNGELFNRYFQSRNIQTLFALITLLFTLCFMVMQARAAGIFLNVFSGSYLPVSLGVTLALILPAVYVGWGGLRGILHVYKTQSIIIILGILVLIFATLTHLNKSIGDNLLNIFNSESGVSLLPNTLSGTLSEQVTSTGSYFSFLGLALLFLAIPCLTVVFTATGATKKPPSSQSILLGVFVIGLLVVVAVPLTSLALELLELFALSPSQLASPSNTPATIPSKGLSGILFPSFEDSAKSIPLLALLVTKDTLMLNLLIALCIFSSLQLAGAGYLAHTTATVTKHIIEPLKLPMNSKNILLTVLAGITLISLALALIVDMPLLNLFSLAFALACQALPAIIGLTYLSFITRSGVQLGMLAGVVTVILTEPSIIAIISPQLANFPAIQSVLCGLSINCIVVIVLSLATADGQSTRHRQVFHNFLRGYAGLPRDKRYLIRPTWIAIITWMIFAFSPVLLLDTSIFELAMDFGAPAWLLSLPFIWGWQLLWWILGMLLLWFLANKMELAYCAFNDPAAVADPATVSMHQNTNPK